MELAIAFDKMKQLTCLHLDFGLSGNHFDQGVKELTVVLPNMKQLTDLYLGFQSCSGISAQSIKELVCALSNIEQINQLSLYLGEWELKGGIKNLKDHLPKLDRMIEQETLEVQWLKRREEAEKIELEKLESERLTKQDEAKKSCIIF